MAIGEQLDNCVTSACVNYFLFSFKRVPFRNSTDESMKSTKVLTVKLMYPVLPVLQIVANSNIACKGGCVKNRT